eukprot:scaffold105762_cov22-Tisochrysis_lutea.AAC.1
MRERLVHEGVRQHVQEAFAFEHAQAHALCAWTYLRRWSYTHNYKYTHKYTHNPAGGWQRQYSCGGGWHEGSRRSCHQRPKQSRWERRGQQQSRRWVQRAVGRCMGGVHGKASSFPATS